jgi:RNA polymerase sigma-70 factor, ECF subfamily
MISENELIERARRFDQIALAEIYDRYSPGIYRYALHLLGDSGLAEDCTADTFARYLQVLHNRRGPNEHLQAYLYRIAHNLITDIYRRQPPPPLLLVEELPCAEPEVIVTVTDRITKEQVRSALKLLTPEQRQVIALKYLEGLENEVVARVLGRTVGTVKSLQFRAINALRRILLLKNGEGNDENE